MYSRTQLCTHMYLGTRVYSSTQLPRPYLATAVGTNSRLNQSTGMPAGMATMTEFQLAAGYLFAGMEVRGRAAQSHSSSE